MIPVDSLIYQIDQKCNSIAALENQVIPIENKILALREAQLKLIKVKMDPNNPLGLGFDSFKKRYEDLQSIIEPYEKHPLTLTLTDKNLNKWSTDLTILDPNYMFYVDCYVLATKDSCSGKVLYVDKDLARHSDVQTLFINSNTAPSFEYEETFCTISDNKLEIYTDGTFKLDKAYISYVRYPKEIDYPGYINFDGKDSTKVDCELHLYLQDELLNYAIQELAMDTGNVPVVQSTELRIKQSE